MSVWLNFDYMSVGKRIDEKEIDLLCESSKVDKETGTMMVQIGAKLREEYKNGDLPYAPSIGDLINWGLLISDAFMGLSVTLQAVIILLHRLHNRTKNKLTIRPCALEQFGIHRNRLPGYIQQLMNAGFLHYIENNDFEFTWIDSFGKPNFYRFKINIYAPI